MGDDHCAGYSGCTWKWNIAMATANVLRIGALRGLLRVRGEGGSGCEGVAKVVADMWLWCEDGGGCKEVG